MQSGQRLALALSYLSTARTQNEIQAAADELFEYLRPHAEHEKDKAVVVIARLGSGSETVDQDVLYERQSSGKWKPAAGSRKSLPPPAPALAEEERDLAGSRVAKQSGGTRGCRCWTPAASARAGRPAAPFPEEAHVPRCVGRSPPGRSAPRSVRPACGSWSP